MGNRGWCGPNDRAGHWKSGRCALSPTGIPIAEARQSLRRLRAPDPLGSRTGFPLGHFGPGPVAPRVESWGTQDDSAACRAPGGRACQGPFSLSLLLRLWYRGVVSDTSLRRSFVGRWKANFSYRNNKHSFIFYSKRFALEVQRNEMFMYRAAVPYGEVSVFHLRWF